MTALAHAALEQLTDLLGKRLLTDPDSAERYGVDWTKVWAPAPCAIALPETIEEVQQIVEIANEHGLHLVPSGGRTGLSAGAVAANNELVVAFDRMNKVLDFNEFDRAVTVQPGVVTQQLQEFADSKELFRAPRHPYTRMLLDAVPDLEMTGRQRKEVKGEIPNPINPPPGCTFHPRCPFANDRCRREVPRWTPTRTGVAACHGVEEGRIPDTLPPA